jgi:hypothetical protein
MRQMSPTSPALISLGFCLTHIASQQQVIVCIKFLAFHLHTLSAGKNKKYIPRHQQPAKREWLAGIVRLFHYIIYSGTFTFSSREIETRRGSLDWGDETRAWILFFLHKECIRDEKSKIYNIYNALSDCWLRNVVWEQCTFKATRLLVLTLLSFVTRKVV